MEYEVQFTEGGEGTVEVCKPYGSGIKAAKAHARRMSEKHVTAYVVAFSGGEAVGQVVFGHGVQQYVEGCVK